MIKSILLIGTGGFIGSVARYFVSKLNLHIDFFAIPVGTLTVNVIGSFIIGLLTGISDKSTILPVDLRMLLMVGVCGGFTTFSTFSSENLMLMHNGQFLSVFLYSGLSIFLGFLAVYMGYVISNMF
ncbi:MAG: fluoride efflux transporter CrcB [Bacteroidales bacterium]|nr:fluoride efflux transporter CrcB [Bacteroidales bacterium]